MPTSDSIVKARLMSRVDKTATCWLWTGPRHGKRRERGYMGVDGKYKTVYRIAYELFVGPIPPGIFVCHKCDIPHCVNPAHLFLGTNADNMRDAREKHRIRHGERHYLAKLDADKVRFIRTNRGVITYRVMAKMFGVSQSEIHGVIHRRTWNHVA